MLANLRDLGDVELLTELAEMFFDDAARAWRSLRGRDERGRRGGERVAHNLKGSSGNMGAHARLTGCARS